jgi:hypothetical protein
VHTSGGSCCSLADILDGRAGPTQLCNANPLTQAAPHQTVWQALHLYPFFLGRSALSHWQHAMGCLVLLLKRHQPRFGDASGNPLSPEGNAWISASWLFVSENNAHSLQWS